MRLEELIQAFHGCRANKKRTIDAMHFDLHRERDLVRLHEDFEDRDLVPLLYSFIATKPRYREVNACLMQGKVIQYYFDQRVRPIVEEELTDRTYNNRKGYGPDQAVNQLLSDIYEMSGGFTRDCWVFFRDIRAYFPSACLQQSYERYRRLIERRFPEGRERDDLLYILMRTTWSYTAWHTKLKSPKWKWTFIEPHKSVVMSRNPWRGAALGNQHWQVERNYALNDFDHRQTERNDLRYGRFVDDMWWVFGNKAQGLLYMKEVEAGIARMGYQLHPLKRYCQHYTKGGSFISTPFRIDRVYVNNGVVNRVRLKIAWWNKHVGVRFLASFQACMNSYLGKMKRLNAYGVIRNLLERITRRWWRLCYFDDKHKCIRANYEYRRNALLMDKYHFKYKENHGKREPYYRNGFTPFRPSGVTLRRPAGGLSPALG